MHAIFHKLIFSSGCEDGTICIHDVRQKEALVTSAQQHVLEVCGLKWTADGRFLASGGNDNNVFVWNLPATREPVHRLMEHKSAVKASTSILLIPVKYKVLIFVGSGVVSLEQQHVSNWWW